MLKYKGYFGSVETSVEDMVLHGRIECINDLVTYEADNLHALKNAFEEAVDDYLETCREVGKDPDKSMSGSFNVRIGAELHKRVYVQSRLDGININEFVKQAVKEKLEEKRELHIHVNPENSTRYDLNSMPRITAWHYNGEKRGVDKV